MTTTKARTKRARRPAPQRSLGPVADLEQHLPDEWWRKLFNAVYVKTDGDVVENSENTRLEVDFIQQATDITPKYDSSIYHPFASYTLTQETLTP
ncbi:MAG: hypothetical protein RLZ98_3051 [Pseudomonadota bacterium]|jgi:D-alanine-D-alanine ligase